MNGDFISSASAALAAELDRMRAAAWWKYRELLSAPAGVSDSKAVAALRNAAGVLGKSAEDVAADARLLDRVRGLQESVAAGKPLAEQVAAEEAFKAYDAETAEVIRERREGYRRLYCLYETISYGRSKAMMAGSELERLRKFHPALLAAE